METEGGKKWRKKGRRKKEGKKLVEVYVTAYGAASNNLQLPGTYESDAF